MLDTRLVTASSMLSFLSREQTLKRGQGQPGVRPLRGLLQAPNFRGTYKKIPSFIKINNISMKYFKTKCKNTW